MTFGYLDSSAVMRWLEWNSGSPPSVSRAIGPTVDAILNDSQFVLAASETTVLEVAKNINADWRKTDAEFSTLDQAWAQRSRDRWMGQLGSGRVEVVSTPARAAEHAMTLVDSASALLGIGLGVWDALHLLCAARWASEVGSQVEIIASDNDYEKFLYCFPGFSSLVVPRILTP